MLASSILDHMIVPEPHPEVEPANGMRTTSQEGKAQETLKLQQQVQAGNAEAGGALPQVCMGNWNLASPKNLNPLLLQCKAQEPSYHDSITASNMNTGV